MCMVDLLIGWVQSRRGKVLSLFYCSFACCSLFTPLVLSFFLYHVFFLISIMFCYYTHTHILFSCKNRDMVYFFCQLQKEISLFSSSGH